MIIVSTSHQCDRCEREVATDDKSLHAHLERVDAALVSFDGSRRALPGPTPAEVGRARAAALIKRVGSDNLLLCKRCAEGLAAFFTVGDCR